MKSMLGAPFSSTCHIKTISKTLVLLTLLFIVLSLLTLFCIEQDIAKNSLFTLKKDSTSAFDHISWECFVISRFTLNVELCIMHINIFR